jgi:DNA polymerase-3 subunit gamma/tau
MSYVVLARKWRPQSFDEIIGQEHVSRTLKNAILNDRVAHAYTFAGPRGVGKTTTARLLSKSLNCEKGITIKPCNECSSCLEIANGTSLDVLEIDGASNRGIDDIRSLRDNVRLTPNRNRFKIYIIDEVHMLTTEAFNALLKTLEEPPAHVKFMLATTMAHKVPLTILSRCQKFDFKRISAPELVKRLQFIAREEKLDVEESAFFAIANGAEGSMRDALSILDQLASFSEGRIKEDGVNTVLGVITTESLFSITDAIISGDRLKGIEIVGAVIDYGKDFHLFFKSLIQHFRNIIVANLGLDEAGLIDLPPESLKALKNQAAQFTMKEAEEAINILADAEEKLRKVGGGRIPLELAILKLIGIKNTPFSQEYKLPVKDFRPAPLPKLVETKKAPSPEKPELLPKSSPPIAESADHNEKTTLSLENVLRDWQLVLEKIKKEKISVWAFLKEGKLTKLNDGVITIAFSENFSFYKQSLERQETRQFVEKALMNVFAHRLGIKCIISEESSIVEESNTVEKSVSDAPEGQIEDILDMFGGRVVEVKELKS